MTGEPRTLEEAAQYAAIAPKTTFRLLGLGKNKGYDCINRGEIPSIVLAGKTLVPVVPLLRLVGADSLCQRDDGVSVSESTPSHRVTTHAGVNPSDNGAAGTAPSRTSGVVGGVPHERD
jgi:hypothetical protein